MLIIQPSGKHRGITLVELMIVLILLSVLALGFSSIYIFAHQNLVVAVRRARLQNEMSYFIEHISKNVLGTRTRGGAVGTASLAVRTVSVVGGYYLYIRVDSNQDGALTASDAEISYYADFAPTYQVLFSDPDLGINNEVICPNHITFFFVSRYPNRNYFDVILQSRWSPASLISLDNPAVTMRSRIIMPAVSTD